MKKVTFFSMLLSATMAWAQGPGPQAVSLIVDGTTVYYKLNDQSWWDNSLTEPNEYHPDLNTLPWLDGVNLGTPASLKLDGAAAISWGPVGTDANVLLYSVYKQGTTAPPLSSFQTLPIDYEAGAGGNDRLHHVSGKDIDLKALATDGPGVYVFAAAVRFNSGDPTTVWGATFTLPYPFNLSIGGPMLKNIGLTATPYTFTASTAASPCQWTVNGTGVAETTATLSHTFAAAGTYTIRCAVDATNYAEQTVTIFEKSADANKITGGGMADASKWASVIEPHPTVSMQQTNATWNAPGLHLTNNTDMSRFLIYQPVYLLGGKTYTFDCDVTTVGTPVGVAFQLYITKDNVPENGKTFVIDGNPPVGEIAEDLLVGELRAVSWQGEWASGTDIPFTTIAKKLDKSTSDCQLTPDADGMYFVILREATWNGSFDFTIKNLSLTSPEDIPTSAAALQQGKIQLANGKGLVRATFGGTASVQIYSLQGALLKNITATGSFAEALPAGVYLVKINGNTYKTVVF
ncbi:MAG: T9SS type A sorting domain-containing protein [Bacteroidales bacterium]|jgi:hypothetical protein|nr:T9SS type A sorting domain-containing protein [Bacteroidales bacterium]